MDVPVAEARPTSFTEPPIGIVVITSTGSGRSREKTAAEDAARRKLVPGWRRHDELLLHVTDPHLVDRVGHPPPCSCSCRATCLHLPDGSATASRPRGRCPSGLGHAVDRSLRSGGSTSHLLDGHDSIQSRPPFFARIVDRRLSLPKTPRVDMPSDLDG